MNMRWLVIASVAVLAASASAVEFGAPFTDGAVLQRDRPVRVWGRASAGAEVAVSFGTVRVTALADAQGDWRAELPPQPASGTPCELVATAAEGEARVRDVLVGEVWLAAGQSNMEMPLGGGANRFRDEAGLLLKQYVRRANVRFLPMTVYNRIAAKPQRTTAAKWVRVTPETIGELSAVAWYFAEELNRALDIPIGIVSAHVGGTGVDAWTPREGYDLHPELELASYPVTNEWTSAMKKGPVTSRTQQPTVLYNVMIAPVTPYSLRGAIWYQGEHNVSERGVTGAYSAKMHALFDGWRRTFDNPGMKLYYVQIAPFDYEATDRGAGKNAFLPRLQLEQAKFAAEETNAAMVVTGDVGSLGDVHPHSKLSVGRRLALLALKNDYGFDGIVAESPTLAKARVAGDVVNLDFDGVRTWNVYRSDRTTDLSFEVLDLKGVWRPAEVLNMHIPNGYWDGNHGCVLTNRLVIGARDVPTPRGVRYLFTLPFKGGLQSNWGLPLGPFEWLSDK